jgi:uncharacterized protein YbjT (DUF2867 family)
MEKKTIVVCGGTGNQGGAVVDALLKKQNWHLVALSRNPEGAKAQALKEKGVTLKNADLRDKASLISAFKGAYGVYGVTQPFSSDYKKSDPKGEIEQGRNIVDSCVEAGIGHLVLSTVFGRDTPSAAVSHVDSKTTIVEYLKKTKVPYTILRPASFMDNIGTSFFPVKKGTVRGYTDKDVKIPYIAAKDIGEFAALVFEQPDLYRLKEMNLAGDLVSGEELARMLSKIRNGEPFKYTAIPRLVMWLFAREFYQMRIVFEKAGRPPYPVEYADALRTSKQLCPDILTMEQYLLSRGFDVKQL